MLRRPINSDRDISEILTAATEGLAFMDEVNYFYSVLCLDIF